MARADAHGSIALDLTARRALAAGLAVVLAPLLLRLPWWIGVGVVGIFALQALGRPAPPPRAWLLALATVAVAVGVLAEYRTLFGREAGVALLGAMAGLKLLEAARVRDGMLLVVLGYLLVMGNLMGDQTMLDAVHLVAAVTVLLAVQGSLVPAHRAGRNLRRALAGAGRAVLWALPLAALLFMLVPRIPGPLWSLPRDADSGHTGLSDSMSPGTLSELIRSPGVALRARFDGVLPAPAQRYWRGPVLERYDGVAWRRYDALPAREPVVQAVALSPGYSVMLEPHGQRWLLALDWPVQGPPDARQMPTGELMTPRPVRELRRYRASSALVYTAHRLNEVDRMRALRLPVDVGDRARQLARDWRRQGRSDRAVVDAALAHFRNEPFSYTLTPPLVSGDPIDGFLFGTRAGFCEHYAGAFTFLMRAAGIPARVVTGYQGGELNPLTGDLVVRQADAHAWAEVWLGERGWTRIDPTAAISPTRIERGIGAALGAEGGLSLRAYTPYPLLEALRMGWDAVDATWSDWVLGYGPERQQDFLRWLGLPRTDWRMLAGLLGGLLAVTGVLVLVIAARRAGTGQDPLVRAYQLACGRLSRRGLPRGPSEGPVDYAGRVARTRPDLAAAFAEITRLYCAQRYAGVRSAACQRELQRRVRRFRPRERSR